MSGPGPTAITAAPLPHSGAGVIGSFPPSGKVAAAKPPAPLPHSGPQHELIDAVRHWVHFDNLAESLTKQVNNARQMRSTFEDKVLRLLETSGMRNAVLQISGATRQRAARSKSTDLSWGFLEEQLHEYYKSKGRADETPAILDFLQKHRGAKQVEYLKKTLATEAASKK